jgi:hypothetical protein
MRRIRNEGSGISIFDVAQKTLKNEGSPSRNAASDEARPKPLKPRIARMIRRQDQASGQKSLRNL